MNRPDLFATFTKILLWEQTQFRKILYLDADVLPLRAPDELFSLDVPFAAAPETGFPDCFNSGVMMLAPNRTVFESLLNLATAGISFDGGDQGLLNMHFRDFYHLSFRYNVELYRTYKLYMPAVRHFRDHLSIIHFIGKEKPWQVGRDFLPPDSSSYWLFYKELVNHWWYVHDTLSAS